jgi:hypothetical protein
MVPESPRRGLALAAIVGIALAITGCHRRHVPVTEEPELGYPACSPHSADGSQPDAGAGGSADCPICGRFAADGDDDPGVSVGSGHIRSGPYSAEHDVVERFDLRRTACGYTFRSRQEWPRATSDVEVRYDAELRPIWAWKRMTIPGSPRPDGSAEIRRYELRTGDVFIKRRDAAGVTVLEQLLAGGRRKPPPGARVGAVIAPGRGMITAWLQRAKLPVGAKTHELVLDFRSQVESLEMASLERNEDRLEPTLGKQVRVYTFYGSETVLADERDVVVGDLAGMRPSASLSTPEPPSLPLYGAPDPRQTP